MQYFVASLLVGRAMAVVGGCPRATCVIAKRLVHGLICNWELTVKVVMRNNWRTAAS